MVTILLLDFISIKLIWFDLIWFEISFGGGKTLNSKLFGIESDDL